MTFLMENSFATNDFRHLRNRDQRQARNDDLGDSTRCAVHFGRRPTELPAIRATEESTLIDSDFVNSTDSGISPS
jgi:hypothetical protein